MANVYLYQKLNIFFYFLKCGSVMWSESHVRHRELLTRANLSNFFSGRYFAKKAGAKNAQRGKSSALARIAKLSDFTP